MRLHRTLILLPALAVSGCLASEPGCAGWRQILVADETVDHLAAHDPDALAALIAHQEAGQKFGCWK